MTSLVEFLLARVADDEHRAQYAMTRGDSGALNYDGQWYGAVVHAQRWEPARVLAECEAKRKIIKWHQNWPVLVTQPPTFDHLPDDMQSATLRMSQQIAWLTDQEYRARFGTEPPTGPVLRLLALPYSAHPEWREEWRAQ